MEGLIIRERILGTDNTELRHPIRYRGAVFADAKNYDLCIGLWEHAMEIGQRSNKSLRDDLESMASLFGEMLQKNALLRSECVQGVFEKLVIEYERQKKKFTSKTTKLKENEANLLKEELEELIYCALYLLMIYTKVQISENKESIGFFDLMQRFLLSNPRTRDGNTPLHLAAWYKTEIKEENVRLVCKLPCVETIKLIMHAGCNVNAINSKGNSPLHLAVAFKPDSKDLQLLRDVLETLLDGGIHEDLVNGEGKTAMDIAETDEARRILSVRRTVK